MKTLKWISLLTLTIVCFFVASCSSKDDGDKDDCIDPAKIKEDAICTLEYVPVCGCNNETYPNVCAAENSGVLRYTEGVCPE